jgi:hypothetical protein
VRWKLGLLRVQDVAIGCAVSLVVGVLFWPRGASSVVGDDLADAFRRGAAYLTQAVDWALGTRRDPPDTAAAAVTAGIRLDEALRGFLAEQGAKRLSKEDLWTLVVATMQLRLTATSLASLQALEPARHHHPGMARAALEHDMADLAGFYERVAALVGRPAPHEVVLSVSVPGPPLTACGRGFGCTAQAGRRLGQERVADLDALICLTGVEILRVQGPAAEFLRATEDHRVPEGRSGSLVDFDGRENVVSGGSVHVPVSQIANDPGGGRGIERLRYLPRRGDEELLQYLDAQAALPVIPQLLDQGAGAAVLIPGRHVVGVDEDVRVDELAVTAHAGRPGTR